MKSQVARHGSPHLSKTGQELLPGSCDRFDRWQVEWVVDPLLQVTVGKEVQPEQCRQIRERPTRLGEMMQEAQKQQSDQRCPDLNPQCVLADADEGLDLQVLLDRLEEHLDLLPQKETFKTVKAENIDLIIMFAHEEGYPEHFLFGRSNEEIVRRMPCSVFLVKKEPGPVK